MIRWKELCCREGPTIEGFTFYCERAKDHFDLIHHTWNDEGTVKIMWYGGPPFNYGSGSWREEHDEV